MVSLNVLHGLPLAGSCDADTDHCRAPERLALLWDAIESEAACPDVVALQEIGPRQEELVPDQVPALCDGRYQLLFSAEASPDQEMILTSLPVLDDAFVDLSGFPWTGHWARLDTPAGPVDVFATHFASSALNPDCGADPLAVCSPACPEGIETGSCNAIEALAWLDDRAAGAALQLLVGDLNKPIDHPRIARLTDAGFADAWLLAGNPECDPASGAGCTCCVRGETDLDGLDLAEQTFDARIDYVLARPRAGCELTVDRAEQFLVGPLDPATTGLVWFSDHHGILVTVSATC